MKRARFIISLLACIPIVFLTTSFSYADDTWNGTDTSGNAYRTGNVGIGTSSPSRKLHIDANSDN
jgi:hypothetical protein